MTETISLTIALASIVIAIYFDWRYRKIKYCFQELYSTYEELIPIPMDEIDNWLSIRKELKKVTEYKDVLWITNQELGKRLKEAKNETVHFKKLYVDTWHQNQDLRDMRSENLSFLITVKPNNIKRKRPSTKTSI